MTRIKGIILLAFLTFGIKTVFCQAKDTMGVYPNPFISSTTIYLYLVQTDTVSLVLFDLQGRVINTFFQDTVLAGGAYEIVMPGDSLADGIYILRLDLNKTPARGLAKKVVKGSMNSGIGNNDLNGNSWVFFPNPVTDLLTIPVEGTRTITITDIYGRTLRSFSTDLKAISLRDLPAGQYFVTISTEDDHVGVTRKIVRVE